MHLWILLYVTRGILEMESRWNLITSLLAAKGGSWGCVPQACGLERELTAAPAQHELQQLLLISTEGGVLELEVAQLTQQQHSSSTALR